MVYKSSANIPDWTYQKSNLPSHDLPTIQDELIKAFRESEKQMTIPYTSTYGEMSEEHIKKLCPMLCEYLTSVGLLTSLRAVAFVSIVHDKVFQAHVDEPPTEVIALNIPLINCEGTYTFWYDGVVTQKPPPEYMVGHPSALEASCADESTLVQIDRVEWLCPYWINTGLIHKAVTTHNQLRVVASVRFYQNPLDEHGQLWSHLVA